METTVVTAFDRQWDRWLEGVAHDFQHTAAYHRLAEQSGEGRAYLVVHGCADKFFAWPYLLRSIESPEWARCYTDVTSVYGYGGLLVHNCATDPDFLETAWAAVLRVWQDQRVVSVFTRFHPPIANQTAMPISGVIGLQQMGSTVAIDLRKDDETRWREYKRQLQQHIRRGRELGLVVEFDAEWKYLREFEQIYWRTMRRNAASQYYFFTHEFFLNLKAELGPHGMLVIVRLGSQIISACLVIAYAGYVNTHLAGTLEEYLLMAPFKTLVHELCSFAKRNGNHTVHLGGGRGGSNDSLFRFKSEFSRVHHPFYVGKWIFNKDVYEHLSDGFVTDYFPAYRAPGASDPPAVKPRSAVAQAEESERQLI